MPALARGDAEQLLRFVGEAESLGGDEPFTGDLLVELGRIVQADWISYIEHDLVPRRLLTVERPGDTYDDGGYVEGFCAVIRYESPIRLRRLHGDFRALRLSDFLTQRELHRTRLYEVALRPWGIEHELEVDLPAPTSHLKTFAFDRADRPFTARDRLVLDVLQPHLVRLWRGARTRRLLAGALAGLDHAGAGESRGVILLGARCELEYASAAARRLCQSLPEGALSEWLEAGSPRPLVHRRVTVERVADALLLEEARDDFSLTAREREVLTWVARGKTNAEVARVLWVAPSTVSKHLEHVYTKLGVQTRTAAVARFVGGFDVEGREGVVSARH